MELQASDSDREGVLLLSEPQAPPCRPWASPTSPARALRPSTVAAEQRDGRSRRLKLAAAGLTAGTATLLVAAWTAAHVGFTLVPQAGVDRSQQRMWDAHGCERCPVGYCLRDAKGHCKRRRGSYHCRVRACRDVPAGMDYSGCWLWSGQPHYSIVGKDAPPCRKLPPAGASGSTAARMSNGTASDTNASREAVAPRPEARDEPAGPPHLLLDEASRIERLQGRDPRLTAYWDVFHCGPQGDDHNLAWCGGWTHKPECRVRVEVDTSVCGSGSAALAYVDSDDGGGRVWIGGCMYIYFAQYVCLESTTTTTTSSTTVTSTTTSSMTTSSTTSSSSSATFTTTTTSSSTSTTQTVTSTTTSSTSSTSTTRPCHEAFEPPQPPLHATDFNGIRLPDVCFSSPGPHTVFVIGDWGGLIGDEGPKPARQRPKKTLVKGVDDRPQQLVAEQMRARAAKTKPDYVLNAGDCFYWGGIDATCGAPAYEVIPTGQLKYNFEKVYTGEHLEGKPWLGVLGNHDYGGFMFTKGWDQLISYTWGPGGRWVMPAQFWRSTVRYPDVSVDYFFVDTNVWDALEAHADPGHNLCSLEHNPANASCGAEGPSSVWDCPKWFARLWEAQKQWLEDGLGSSSSDWQVIVTHFPPTWGKDFWVDLADRHGIDLFVSGHMHRQVVYNDPGGFLSPSAWLVSGGGGGITSEDIPTADGHDDQYGFFELTLSREAIEVVGISHGGHVRVRTRVHPRDPADFGSIAKEVLGQPEES